MDKRIEECGEAIQAHFYAPYDSPEVSESVDSIVARHFAKWEAEQAELITRLADTVTKQRERIAELERELVDTVHGLLHDADEAGCEFEDKGGRGLTPRAPADVIVQARRRVRSEDRRDIVMKEDGDE